jgi:hypothetical protein
MIAFFSNLYKNNPIQFLLIIAVVYLLLNQTKVVENLKTDQVDLTAISTVSQLAQKWDKAVGIDPHGNVTFKKNAIINGRVGIGVAQPKANLDILGNSASHPCIKMGPNDAHGYEFYEDNHGRFVLKRHDGGRGKHNVMVIHRGNGQIDTNGNVKVGGDIHSRNKKVVTYGKQLHIKNDFNNKNYYVQRWDEDRLLLHDNPTAGYNKQFYLTE